MRGKAAPARLYTPAGRIARLHALCYGIRFIVYSYRQICISAAATAFKKLFSQKHFNRAKKRHSSGERQCLPSNADTTYSTTCRKVAGCWFPTLRRNFRFRKKPFAGISINWSRTATSSRRTAALSSRKKVLPNCRTSSGKRRTSLQNSASRPLRKRW